MDHVETSPGSAADPAHSTGAQPEGQALEWVSPGVSVRKRWLTGAAVALAALLFFGIALAQGASMQVSTAIGVVFIGCFVWYLTIVAPTPFTIRLDGAGVTRVDRGREPQTAAWDGIARIKEEIFKNGTPVSLALYKRVGEQGLYRAWVVYRDDVPNFDALAAALRARLPEGTPWLRVTVHE